MITVTSFWTVLGRRFLDSSSRVFASVAPKISSETVEGAFSFGALCFIFGDFLALRSVRCYFGNIFNLEVSTLRPARAPRSGAAASHI